MNPLQGIFKLTKGRIKNRAGMALVITLMVLAILTALVVEFANTVYVNTSLLETWQTIEKLSLAADAGTSVAAELIRQHVAGKEYTYPGTVYLPPYDPFEAGIFVSLNIDDEYSKFNPNYAASGGNAEANYEIFLRLVENLEIEPEYADRIVDWIDEDSISLTYNSENNYKNAPLESVEEILQIPGMDPAVYDKLVSYLTVNTDGSININGASKELIMALHPDIDEEMADKVIASRDRSPFVEPGNITREDAFGNMGMDVINLGIIKVKGATFLVKSTATSTDGLRRDVTCVMGVDGDITYWKEN